MFKSPKAIAQLLMLSIVALFILSFNYSKLLPFQIHKTVRYDKIQFDSRSPDPTLSSVKQFIEKDSAPFKTLSIDFRLKINSIGSWNNVFQTADSNDGLRMEMTAPSTLAILIGHMTARKIGDERNYGVMTNLLLNQFYSIHIDVSRDYVISVNVNGQPVVHEQMTMLDHSPLNFDIARVAVGTGYNETRPLDGVIQDFSIEYTLINQGKIFNAILSTLRNFLTLIVYGLTACLLYAYKGSITKGIYKIYCCTLSREGKIRYVVFVMTIGFIASVFFHYMKAMFWLQPFPLNTFLPGPVTRYGDMYGPVDQWTQWRFNGVGMGLSYFPSTYLILDALRRLGPIYMSVIVSLALFSIFTLVYVYVNIRTEDPIETTQNTLVCALTSYPFLFTYHTANLEMYVFMFLCLFVYFYQQKRFHLSAFCLAMPISMKLFPIVFIVLFLADRRYRAAIYTLCWAAALTLIPLLLFRGGIRDGVGQYLAHLKASQAMYKDLMIMNTPGLHFGHSLLGAFRIIFSGSFPPMKTVLLPYLGLTMLIFTAMSAYIVFIETEFWKKVALLVLAMDLLPYTSTDYKLMHVFIPLFLFVNCKKGAKFDMGYAILFSLLLIPKDYCYFHNWPLFSLNNILNPFIMLFIVICIVSIRDGRRSLSAQINCSSD